MFCTHAEHKQKTNPKAKTLDKKRKGKKDKHRKKGK